MNKERNSEIFMAGGENLYPNLCTPTPLLQMCWSITSKWKQVEIKDGLNWWSSSEESTESDKLKNYNIESLDKQKSINDGRSLLEV